MKKQLPFLGVVAGFVLTSLLASDMFRFSQNLLPPQNDIEAQNTVDLIVVLTGGRGRLKEGIKLLREERAAHLLVSGIGTNISLSDILSANNLDDLEDHFQSRILLGDLSKSTEENAQEIKSVSKKLEAESILIVTSSYHIRRALKLVEREFKKAPTLPLTLSYQPVETPNFDRNTWWKSFTGWRIFLSEYIKSLPFIHNS